MDGGIRKGTDVLKALAMGARIVFTGRPAVWGLATAGQKGVEKMLQVLFRKSRYRGGGEGTSFQRPKSGLRENGGQEMQSSSGPVLHGLPCGEIDFVQGS